MKNYIIVLLTIFIGILYLDNRRLKQINKLGPYQTNLTREEMKEALYPAVNDTIAVMIPYDTNVMPYLIKQHKQTQGEYARR